ncbi:hypothetical protein [Methyloceanibacter marginalis]|uniref:hypothetical protein n=1 Tax=Methyloceanibacter marginalis TaxID=1774971 RepID=UPI0013017019
MEGEHEAIIDAETWEKVQAQLAANAGRSAAGRVQSTRACSQVYCSRRRMRRSRHLMQSTTVGGIGIMLSARW